MLIPILEGWVAGEKATAAKLTKHTKTAIEAAVYYKPFCELQINSTQSLSTGFTKINLATIVEDTDGMADVPNNQIAIKTAGRYRISGQIAFEVGAASRGSFIAVNGNYKASTTSSNAGTADRERVQVSRTLRLVAGDKITLVCYTSSAVTTESVTYGGSWLSAEWVSL